MSESVSARRIVVDREACMGSGACIVYAPATFAHDDEAKVVVTDGSGDSASVIEAAVESCPTGALSLEAAESDS